MKRLIPFVFVALLCCLQVFGQVVVGGKAVIGGQAVTGASAANLGAWGFLQDTSLSLGSAQQCTSTSTTTCTFSGFIATTANSLIVVEAQTGNNVTISSISGWSCGGTWHVSTGAHMHDATNVGNEDFAWNYGNTGGCTSLTINMSGAPGTSNSNGAGIFPDVMEILPPSGTSSVSLDQVSTQLDASCGAACTLAPFSSGGSNALTATDVVMQFPYANFTLAGIPNGSSGSGSYNAYTAGYLQDYGGNGIGNALYLNAPSGNLAGTAQQCSAGGGCPVSGYADFAALAFKSNLGSFTVSPTPIWSGTNFKLFAGIGTSCSSGGCAITIPSTTGSDLYVVWSVSGSANNNLITACNIGASNCVVPASCQQFVATVGAISCAYILSDPTGATSITINTSATDTYNFGLYEFNKSSGAAVFDCAGAATNSSASNAPVGTTCSPSGTDDLVFHAISVVPNTTFGCVQSVQVIPWPYDAWTNCTGQVYGQTSFSGAAGFAFNQASISAPIWSLYNSTTSKSVVAVMAFK